MMNKIAILPGAAVRPPGPWAHCDIIRVDFPAVPSDRTRVGRLGRRPRRGLLQGVGVTAPGQPWTLLRAIVRRELGDIHEVHGRHVIASVRLNARGMALAEQGSVAA